MRQFGASHRAKNSSTFISEPRITSNLIIKKNVSVHEESSRWLRCTTRGGRCQRTRTTLSWEDSRQRWPVRDSSKDNATGTTASMKIVLFKIIFALHSNIWSTISDIKYDCRKALLRLYNLLNGDIPWNLLSLRQCQVIHHLINIFSSLSAFG